MEMSNESIIQQAANAIEKSLRLGNNVPPISLEDRAYGETPWFEPMMKRFIVVSPIVTIIFNVLVTVYVLSEAISSRTYLDYDTSYIMMDSTETQMTAGIEDCTLYTPQVFCDKSIAFQTCPDNKKVSSATLICGFDNDSRFVGMISAFIIWVGLTILVMLYSVRAFKTSDLRFYIALENLQKSRSFIFLAFFGIILTFVAYIIGCLTANEQELENTSVYNDGTIFVIINIYAIYTLLQSPFGNINHVDFKHIFDGGPIEVISLRKDEQNKNFWGCTLSSLEVFELLETALLKTYVKTIWSQRTT